MNNAEKYFNRGRLLSMKGLHQEAIDAYKKALEIDPGHIQARTNLKFISYSSGIGIGEDRVKNVANLKNIEKGAKKLLPKL
ncbi:MAG: tetratricopeptide repeat protein [Pseudomonadota bacterium]